MAQPPSGGCVLKQRSGGVFLGRQHPAAFGRLCVETALRWMSSSTRASSRLRAAVC